MYLNDLQRSGFYASLGLDAREYDIHVIQKTNETAGRVFPVILDVEHPQFYQRLDACVQNNANLAEIAESKAPKPIKLLRKLPLLASTAWHLLRLYLMKPIDTASLAGTVR